MLVAYRFIPHLPKDRMLLLVKLYFLKYHLPSLRQLMLLLQVSSIHLKVLMDMKHLGLRMPRDQMEVE